MTLKRRGRGNVRAEHATVKKNTMRSQEMQFQSDAASLFWAAALWKWTDDYMPAEHHAQDISQFFSRSAGFQSILQPDLEWFLLY